MELVEARWSGVEHPEAIASRRHGEPRLNVAVDEKLVAEDAVEIEQVEENLAADRIDHFVGEQQRDVERRKARQAKPRRFIASVELVEQQVEAGQALVDVLRGEVDTMIVIPERAEALVDVADARVGGVDAGKDVRIVLVVEPSRARIAQRFEWSKEIARVAVAFR